MAHGRSAAQSNCPAEGRVLAGVIEPQKHYVAYPVRVGLQACLVEVEMPNKALQIFDALTVLPRQVQHSVGLPDPVYECWLGLIASFYSVEIANYSADSTVKILAARTTGAHPFLPSRQLGLTIAAEAMLDDGFGGQIRKPVSVAQSDWDGFLSSIEDAKCWHPLHWKTHEARNACEEQWKILAAWEHWEKVKMSWTNRLSAHRVSFSARPATAKTASPPHLSLKQLDAFQKRCRYLGLRLNDVNKANGGQPFQPRRIVF